MAGSRQRGPYKCGLREWISEMKEDCLPFYCCNSFLIYIEDARSFSGIQFTNIFFCMVGWLFSFLLVSFKAQEFFILMKYNLFFFFCCS